MEPWNVLLIFLAANETVKTNKNVEHLEDVKEPAKCHLLESKDISKVYVRFDVILSLSLTGGLFVDDRTRHLDGCVSMLSGGNDNWVTLQNKPFIFILQTFSVYETVVTCQLFAINLIREPSLVRSIKNSINYTLCCQIDTKVW